MKRAVSWATGIVLGLVVAVPSLVLALTLVNRSDEIDAVARPPTPLVVSPTIVETDDAREAMLIVTTARGVEIFSGGGHGRVTAVAVDDGATVQTGDRLYDINGIGRIAAHTPAPFHRDLQSGSTGDDVVALKGVLQALGLADDLDPSDPRYDAATGRAVRELRRLLGDLAPAMTFAPDLVAWLPVPQVTVASVLVRAGSNAPGLGEPVLETAATVVDATVAAPDGAPLPEELVGGPVSETATGRVIGELADAGGAITPDLSTLLPALVAHAGGPGEAAGSTTRLGVTLRRATPVDRLVLPASAVTTGLDGRQTCIWLDGADGWSPRLVQIQAAGQTGSVVVLDDLPADSRVLANPIEVLEAATCPSR